MRKHVWNMRIYSCIYVFEICEYTCLKYVKIWPIWKFPVTLYLHISIQLVQLFFTVDMFVYTCDKANKYHFSFFVIYGISSNIYLSGGPTCQTYFVCSFKAMKWVSDLSSFLLQRCGYISHMHSSKIKTSCIGNTIANLHTSFLKAPIGSWMRIQPTRQPGTRYRLDMLEQTRIGTSQFTEASEWNVFPLNTISA